MELLLLTLDGGLYGSLGIALVTLGVLVSIRFLGFPDLTPDGSFTLGACVYARLLLEGVPEVGAVLAACAMGSLCGLSTGILNEKLQIGKLLASIIVMIVAVSSAPYVLGQATIGLVSLTTVIGSLSNIDVMLTRAFGWNGMSFIVHPVSICAGLGVSLVFAAVLSVFASTRLGVGIRYLGSSLSGELLVTRARTRVALKLSALGVGNALVALGGVVEAGRRGSADQGMGLGIILIAVSALIIGESLVRLVRRKDLLGPRDEVAAGIVGAVTYSCIVQVVLLPAFIAVDVRILTAILLAILLGFSHRRKGRSHELF